MAIDKDSPAYLFGQIIQRFDDFEKTVNRRLDAGDRQFTDINRGLAEVKQSLEKQPCANGCVFVQQMNTAKEEQKEERKTRRNWRDTVTSGLIILMVSILLSVIMNAAGIHI